jgi:phosphoribosylformylglycinamidine synthase subunit PurL
MAQFVGCLEGMADACRALDFPIVSGNVSLYNESKATGGGSAILPTPAIGAVGLMKDWRKAVGIGFKGRGDPLWLIGANFGFDSEIGQSLWMREIHGKSDGSPPRVDLAHERRIGEQIRAFVDRGLINAVHDVSDGGILVAITEMALAGGIGVDLYQADQLGSWGDPSRRTQEKQAVIQKLFSEKQGLYLVTSSFASNGFVDFLDQSEIPVCHLGQVGGDTISFTDFDDAEIPLADLRAAHEGFFPALMGG